MKETALEHYANVAASCHCMIGQLEAALDQHARRQSDYPDNWGFSSDLIEVETQLTKMLAFLGDHRPAKGLNIDV